MKILVITLKLDQEDKTIMIQSCDKDNKEQEIIIKKWKKIEKLIKLIKKMK